VHQVSTEFNENIIVLVKQYITSAVMKWR